MKRNRLGILLVILTFLTCSIGANKESYAESDSRMGVPPPPTDDHGVSCFVESGEIIIAQAPSFHTFHSLNGGFTWWDGLPDNYDANFLGGSYCSSRKGSWELWASLEGVTRYRFDPGNNVQLSTDSGTSWEHIFDLTTISWQPLNTPEPGTDVIVQSGPLDAMIDHDSGNLLLAMGHAGILLRLPSGEWQWIHVGRYYHGEPPQQQTADPAPKLQPAALQPDTVLNAHEHYTTSIAFSPDGNILATSGYDGGIKLFDFPQGDLLFWQQWGNDRRDSTIYGAAFSPDGKTLVTCGTNVDQTLRFWDIESRELIKKYDGFQTGALDVTKINGEQFFAIAYGNESTSSNQRSGCSAVVAGLRNIDFVEATTSRNQIRIFQLPDGRNVSTLKSQLSEITSLHFLPNSSLLAAGGFSGGVELWDIETREKVFTFQPDQQPDGRIAAYGKVYSIGYSPADNAVMAVFGDARLKAWHVSTGEPAWSLSLPAPHGWYLSSAAFSSDNQMVAVGMPNGFLMLFDSKDGRVLSKQWFEEVNTLMELVFSPDSQWLSAGFASGNVKIWQVNRLVQ